MITKEELEAMIRDFMKTAETFNYLDDYMIEWLSTAFGVNADEIAKKNGIIYYIRKSKD